MSSTEPLPTVGLVFFALFCVIWFGFVYLALVRPRTFVEWLIAKPYRPFGVEVSIRDEVQLKRRMRALGLIYAIGGLLFLLLFVVSLSLD